MKKISNSNKLTKFGFKLNISVINFFEANGYIIFKNLISKEELKEFKLEVINIIKFYCEKNFVNLKLKSKEDYLNKSIIYMSKNSSTKIGEIYDTIFHTPSFFRICGNKKIEKIIKFLLNGNYNTSLYGHTNRCRIDPPRDNRRTYEWHQETFYTIPKSRYIQTWSPLIYPSNKKNGTIEILPKSHLEGVPRQEWFEKKGRATQILIENKIIDKYRTLTVEINPGDLLFFSGRLAHRSGNNTSKKVRYSLVGMYHDIKSKHFRSAKIKYSFRGSSPKSYFKKYKNVWK